MSVRSMVLAAGATIALGAPALAQHNFPLFNQQVPNPSVTVPLPVGGVPAGTYNHFSASVSWSAVSGNPWSNEARLGFAGTPGYLNSGAASVAPATGAGANGNPTTLTWSGFFASPYSGGSSLSAILGQTFGGSIAQWNNIAITIDNQALPAAPAATDLGTIGPGMTMTSNTLTAGAVHWYKFSLPGNAGIPDGTFLTIDTLGSTLVGGTFGSGNDSEIGIYSPSGTLLATNDDIITNADPNIGNLLSSLNFGTAPAAGPQSPVHGNLLGGDFYVAVGGFNTVFGNGFSATSTSPVTGMYKLNFNTNVIPAPGVASVLAIAGAGFIRRRRA